MNRKHFAKTFHQKRETFTGLMNRSMPAIWCLRLIAWLAIGSAAVPSSHAVEPPLEPALVPARFAG